MVEPEAHIRIGGEVEHHVAASHRLRQRRRIKVVAAHERVAGMRACSRDERLLPRAKIVPRNHLLALREQAVCEIAADKSGCAGDENSCHSS